MVGAPYLAVRRQWDEGNGSRETPSKADDGQKKISNDGKQEAQAERRSVAETLQGDLGELAKLRDAVK